jgi:hypothetical protein
MPEVTLAVSLKEKENTSNLRIMYLSLRRESDLWEVRNGEEWSTQNLNWNEGFLTYHICYPQSKCLEWVHVFVSLLLVLVVLKFELNASCFLSRHYCHLSRSTSPKLRWEIKLFFFFFSF